MRPIFRVALAASCLLASTAVDAQRHSAPAYHPPPPPPPAPRYTPPPPAANQNMRQGSQAGGSTYHGGQTHSGATSSNLGGYRPGSIANSNSQGSGKESGGAPKAGSGARITGPSAQSGTGGATKSAGSGTAAIGQGKSTPANDKAKAAASTAKTAAQTAGAGAFGAGAKQATSGNAAQGSSTKTSAAVMGPRKIGDNAERPQKDKIKPTDDYCRANPKTPACQFNCQSLVPRPSYCTGAPPDNPQVVKTETPQRVLSPPGPR